MVVEMDRQPAPRKSPPGRRSPALSDPGSPGESDAERFSSDNESGNENNKSDAGIPIDTSLASKVQCQPSNVAIVTTTADGGGGGGGGDKEHRSAPVETSSAAVKQTFNGTDGLLPQSKVAVVAADV